MEEFAGVTSASTRNVRPAIIEKVPLSEGRQSAYRAGRETNWHLDDLRELLAKDVPEGQKLFQIVAVKAHKIRGLQSQSGAKLRVLDETECDTNGNHHRNHVHISPCRFDSNHPLGDASLPWVKMLAEDLANLFRNADQILNVDAA